jgi:multiple sugar transport system ATP-binding protein
MATVSVKDLVLNFGPVKVLRDLNIDIPSGEFLVLLGASGSGKSTLLNCIAGLLDVTDGQIFIGDNNVTWAEPKDRGIGMVFQSYALYPQMTVKGNLSFGLKNAKLPAAEIEERVARAASVLQIEPLLDRKPSALSGGQRQRVAIGRALVRDVDVFLFDEPLSNLDAKLRADLRVEIKRLHQKLKNTMIYVTHDQVEAMTLADRIAIMSQGIILQLDTPTVIYNKPANKYVAGFIGSPEMNFLDGTLAGKAGDDVTIGDRTIQLTGYEFSDTARKAGQQAILGVRPEQVVTGELFVDQPVQATAEVELVEPMGADTLVWSSFEGQAFRFRMEGTAEVVVGDRVNIGFDPAKASLFDTQTELRL